MFEFRYSMLRSACLLYFASETSLSIRASSAKYPGKKLDQSNDNILSLIVDHLRC